MANSVDPNYTSFSVLDSDIWAKSANLDQTAPTLKEIISQTD